MLASSPVARAARDGKQARWLLNGWYYRRFIDLPPQRNTEGDVAYAIFATGGHTKPDGRDIRIVNPSSGQIVPSMILYAGPGDQIQILFQRSSSSRRYHLYYGNTHAPALKTNWRPRAGVMLETWRKPPGTANSWTEARRLFAQADTLQGRSLRPKIWDGVNPHGPDDYYLAKYTAFIRIKQAGSYQFCTTSDDASFVFVDDNPRPVCQWPGSHGAWGGVRGEHSGAISLNAGVHRILYFHVEFTHAQSAVLGWKRPRDSYFHLVENRDFLGVSTGKVGQAHTRMRPVESDFFWKLHAHWMVEDAAIYLVEFIRPSNQQGTWDFGDGSEAERSTKTSIRHLYLQDGSYQVTLRAQGQVNKQTVTVHPKWDQVDALPKQHSRWVLTEMAASASRYHDAGGLLNAFRICMAYDMKESAADILNNLQQKDLGALPGKDLIDLALFHQEPPICNVTKSRHILELALASASHDKDKATAALHLAGLLIATDSNLQQASRLIRDIDRRSLGKHERRLLEIYQGDLAALQGDREKASTYYARAGVTINLQNTKRHVMHEGRLLAAKSLLREDKPDRALQEIRNMQWETPMESMDPDTLILQAEIYQSLALGMLARGSLIKLLKANPHAAQIPAVLYQLTKLETTLGNPENSGVYREELLTKYPYSQEAAKLKWDMKTGR